MLLITLHEEDGKVYGSLGLNRKAELDFWAIVKGYNAARLRKGEPAANPAEVIDYLLMLGIRMKQRVLNGV
ncbi:MAG: hypothetical protein A2V98_17700 [Planctomycetes bacterium RBG_16_64_12]|nr:MAG: hypothetical protein A2V98_17700 [Planctomycetes bacterium RBG_16_64_12]